MASQPSLSDGCWDKAEITDVIDAGNFTVRLLGSETEFIALMGEIQKNSASSSPPSAPPPVGTLVAAQSSFDNQWYRAEVKKVNGDKSLEVKYVDYGNNEKVATVNTRVDPTANRLPCQGVTCSLNRIDYNRAIEQEHREAFHNMCLNQKFTACFVTRSQQDLNRWCIELFHPTGNVNEWFGKKTGGNTSPLTNSQIPTKLPHPHNAGLVAVRSMTPASSAAASPVRPGQSQSPVKKRNVASSFMGSVVYSNNPSEFWLQVDSDLDAVMDIGAKLAEHCNNPSCKPSSSATVGQLCAALYSEDRTWYRGQIMELLPTGAKIYFIDYGNTGEVDSASIVVMPASLQRDPGYAIEACLDGVTSLGTIWSDEASSTFSDIVMAASCQVDVIGTVKSQTKLVNLTSEGSSVGAQLIQAGLAKAAQPSTTASPVRVPAASSRAAPPQTQLPAAAPPSHGYSMLPVDSEQREMVYVSWLLHPGAFWVQKEGCEDTLASLLDSAKECVGQAACISNPAVGTPCVAKYSEDGNWYRGEIVTCLDTSCTVLFIDYGNSEEISKDDIHPASSSLIAIPCQAFKCTLLGIIPNPGAEWSPESHAKMDELLAEGGMCTFLARRGDSYLVEMTYGGEASLQEALVQSGVAKNRISQATTADLPVTRPTQCDWLDSNEGKKRVEEICTLTKTVHTTMVVTCPHDPKRSFPITRAATKFELVIGDIVEILNEVDGVFSSQGSIADSLQKVLYNHRTLSKGIQTCQTVTGKVRHIYYTTMPQKSGESTYLQRIADKIDESLKEFAKLNASSVAFPAIGTGNLGYPPSRVASQMISRCSDYFKRNPQTSIKKICFVTYWTDEFVYQEFKKLLDVREKHGSASSLPPPSPSCTLQKIIVRFSGLSASDVNDAVTRLQAELKSKLIKDDWSSSPLRISISKLTAEQKVTLTVKAEERDVEIIITSDNIVIEGFNEDVKALRDEINRVLYTSEGAVGKLPINWAVMKTEYAEIKLNPVIDGPEYRKVEYAFRVTLQTVGVTITEIIRIQNVLLYTQYEAQKMKVSNELQSDSVVLERSLWHGTDLTTVRQICTNEFNRSFAGKNGTSFGQGSYFATTSNYSLNYAKGYMILAKVATGRYYKGSSSVDRTKLKPGYQSTVNDEANPSIFVVYHDAAAYPEYVIKFSRLGYG